MAKVTITVETSTRKIGKTVKQFVRKAAHDVDAAVRKHPEIRQAFLLFASTVAGARVFTREQYENGRDHDEDSAQGGTENEPQASPED